MNGKTLVKYRSLFNLSELRKRRLVAKIAAVALTKRKLALARFDTSGQLPLIGEKRPWQWKITITAGTNQSYF
jgi:hypothetical protein